MLRPACVFFATVLLVASCTHTINPPKEPFTGYAEAERIPLKVQLRITDELRSAKWERKAMGDTWIIPIGKSIAQNADVLAQHTFREVVASGGADADALITPRVAYIDQTVGATAAGPSIVTIKVEWAISDAAGNVIWLDTVSGEAKGSARTKGRIEELVKKALEEVLLRSQEAMSSSQAIRHFAEAKGGG